MGKVFFAVSLILIFSSFNVSAQSIDNVGSGRALKFDGVNDYVDLGNVYDDLGFPFTVSAWINMDPGNVVGPIFVSQDNTPVYNGFWLVISQAGISFEFGDGDGENNPAFRRGVTLPISNMSSRWIHICGVMWSESNMDLFINGLRQWAPPSGESFLTMDSKFPQDNAKIGTWTSNGRTQFFKGDIDDVRLYNRALTLSEIQSSMCRRIAANEPGLIGYWDFDETSGTKISDVSSKGYHGTLTGGPTRVFSSAPIGDESFSDYTNSITELNWNSIGLKNISANSLGVQIYKVNSLPSQTAGLESTAVPPYYGVFIANYSQEKSFDLNAGCFFSRRDNSVSPWQKLSSSHVISRGEFLMSPEGNLEVHLGSDFTVCPGEYLLGPGVDEAGKNFAWSTGETMPSISVSSPGTYKVAVFEGCKVGEDEITVSFLPAPQLDLELGADLTFCGDGPFALETKLDAVPGRSFSWSTAETDPTISITSSGEYKVTVTESCTTVKDSVSVFILPVGHLDVDLGGDLAVCPGEYVLGPGVDEAGKIFTWSTGETMPSISVSSPGTYKATVSEGCNTGEDEITVSFLPTPDIDLELGANVTICGEGPFVLETKLAVVPGRSFSWSTKETAPTISVVTSGEYKVTVKESCTIVKDSVFVFLLPVANVNIDLGPDRYVCPAEKIELKGPDILGASYEWSSGETTSTIAPVQEGEYTLKISTVCSEDEDSVNLLFLNKDQSSKRFIPNIVTPNADNKNEFLIVEKLIDKPIGLEIFNRWGVQIFQDRDYQNNFAGSNLSDGVYFYNLQDECGNIIRGTVSVSY
jgi:hypothetical protein